jgi:hypothetical protein
MLTNLSPIFKVNFLMFMFLNNLNSPKDVFSASFKSLNAKKELITRMNATNGSFSQWLIIHWSMKLASSRTAIRALLFQSISQKKQKKSMGKSLSKAWWRTISVKDGNS